MVVLGQPLNVNFFVLRFRGRHVDKAQMREGLAREVLVWIGEGEGGGRKTPSPEVLENAPISSAIIQIPLVRPPINFPVL